MRNKKSKKGFTLVELLVVIAILAVLATVSVVGYMSFTKKAQISNDESLVAQLNIALKADEAVEGKPATPSAMLERMEEEGFNVEKLTPTTSKYNIVWNQEENQFALLDEKDELVYGNAESAPYKTWKFINAKDYVNTTKYSIFLKGNESLGDITAKTGLDIGNNTSTTIKYENEDTREAVILRTNGGALEVNAKNDTVSHYGTASKVTIEAVAMNSYHEYGEVVGDLEVKKGRVEVTDEGKVGTVLVSSAAEGDVKVEVETGAEIGTVAPTTDAAKKDIDASTTIPAESKKEEIVEINTDFAGGLGTERSPYLIATAEQFVNIGKSSDEMRTGVSKYFKLIADIDLRTYNDFNQFGENNVKAISGYFRGCLDGKKDSDSNYKLIANDSLYYIFLNSIGSSLFSNIDYYYANELVAFCPGQSGNTTTTFDNVDMYTVDKNTSIKIVRNQGLYCHWIALDVFKNDWSSNNNVIVKNADVYVNLIGEEYNAVFFGGSPYFGGNGTVMDSTYYGNYYGEWTNLVLGNTAHKNAYSLQVTNVANKGLMAATKGTPMIAGGTYDANTKEDKYGVYTNVSLGVNRYLYDEGLEINANGNGLKITQASSESTDYYVLSISGGTRRNTPTSENSIYTFRVKITKDNFVNNEYQTNFKDGKLATVAQYKEFVDSNATFDNSKAHSVYGEENADFWMIEKDGTLYYVFDFHDNDKQYFITKPDGVPTSSVVDVNSATIIAYDNEGLPIAQKEITLR